MRVHVQATKRAKRAEKKRIDQTRNYPNPRYTLSVLFFPFMVMTGVDDDDGEDVGERGGKK